MPATSVHNRMLWQAELAPGHRTLGQRGVPEATPLTLPGLAQCPRHRRELKRPSGPVAAQPPTGQHRLPQKERLRLPVPWGQLSGLEG